MSKRTIYKLSVVVVIAAVVAAVLLVRSPKGKQTTAAASNGVCAENDDKAPIKIRALEGSTGDTVKQVAENGKFRLMYDGAKGLVHLEDKSSGNRWYNYPQNLAGISESQLALIQNPMVIRYTQGANPTLTNPLKEAGTAAPALIEGGVRIDYALTSIGLHFAMEYRLTADGMQVKVPYESIKEGAGCKLVSLEPLPYFDAANAKENGYLFIPDGSGAIVNFKEKHLEYFDRYYQNIYGGDPAFKTKTKETVLKNSKEDVFPAPQETIAMPVFGINRGKQGFAAIVTEGDHDAKIVAAPSGYQNIGLYRASVEFTYRNDDVIFIGDSGEVPMYQGGMIQGDRGVRYVPLQGEQSGYVGMANAYRSYLTNDLGVKPVPQDRPELQLQLVGGVVRDEILGSTYVKMTTFEQVKEIIDRFTEQGVDAMGVTLEGWSDGGVFGSQPLHFPVAGKLGGSSRLADLANYAKSKGIRITLDANYVKPFADSGTFKESKDVIRGLNREPMVVRQANLATLQQQKGMKFLLLKPETAVSKMNKELAKYEKLGISGIRADHVGELLYSDQSPSSLYSRKQTAESWKEVLDSVKNRIGGAAVNYGNAYTFGHVNRIDGAPMDSSHFIFEDRTVPFYQIVLRGLIPYYGEPGNMREDGPKSFLRMIEYGAMPLYRLSYANSSNLQRTPLNDLISSDYRDWLEPAAEEYRKAAKALKPVTNQPIVGHEQLEADVYRTTFANGVAIYVNYGESAKLADNVRIEAGSYAVVEGGSAK